MAQLPEFPTPAHDWLHPRLVQLLVAAEAAGIQRDVAVAVITDLITDTEFNEAPPEPEPE